MRSVLLLSVLITGSCAAQNWCTPGATWTYEAGLWLAGFNRMTYTHDTLVGGYNAQIIDRYSAIQFPQPPPGPTFGGPPYISYTPVAVITRVDGDVVYTWQTPDWDTLYWFGASPGQGWTMAHAIDSLCTPFVVQDTGTAVVDGIALRWLLFDNWYRVYERIGSTWDMFMYCPNLIIDGPAGMRCYHDHEIDTMLVQGACEQFVGIASPESPLPLRVSPNPGRDHFTIAVPQGADIIHVFDATGRAVLRQRLSAGTTRIDATSLKPGLFSYRITALDGALIGTGRWVKE